MIYGPIFYVNKRSGTFADTLTAYGLAKILEGILINSIGPQAPRKISIRDAGPYYTVKLENPLPVEYVEKCPFFSPARPIKTPKQPCEGLSDPWDYNAEWELFKQSLETAQALRKSSGNSKATDTDAQKRLDDLKVSPAFSVLTLLGDYRMAALPVYNQIVTQWHHTRNHFDLNLRTILDMCSSPDKDLKNVASLWWRSIPHDGNKNEVTASQLFNPTQGKGQNRTKANVLVMGNETSFWLLEYLKAVGLWICAAPRKVTGGDDRKTYVLSPINLSLGSHQGIFDKFAERLWNDTSAKMDCKAALLYTQELLKYSESNQQSDIDFEGYGPENIVAGFYVTTYKLLKNYVVINMAFVGLPHWTGKVRTRDRFLELTDVIDEHLMVIHSIRTMDEKGRDLEKSEIYTMLNDYRNFVSSNQWTSFFAFVVGYSQYLISEWNKQNLHPVQFTTENLRRLFMGVEPRYGEIIENEGFLAIATAIRNSTVIPQYQKARSQQGKGEKPLYEIRYGLGQELKRKAAYKNEFVTALSDFLQAYNQENAQKAETQQQQWRKNVRISDIENIVKLIDKFGSEVVCNLLVAFGYARDSKDSET